MEYNRLVAYIYSYEEGVKGKNCGFARIELRENILKLKLTLLRGCVNTYSNGSISMYYRKDGEVSRIKLGNVEANSDGGEFEYRGDGSNIEGSGISFEGIGGLYIMLYGEKEYIFGSEWDDLGFITQEKIVLEVAEYEETPKVQAYESPWDEIRRDRESVIIFADDTFFDIVEITPSDIERMPNTNWGLLNNSFVNYGYNMFRHLIMGSFMENGVEKHFVGIPGIYNHRERLTAGMYGFDRFKFSMRSDMRLSQFGYWYKVLSD